MTHFEKFRDLLRELFQLDQADLDFGLYRIMNARRDEILRFLDRDLLPQVRAAFEDRRDEDAGARGELDRLLAQLADAGVDPGASPKVRALRDRLAGGGADAETLEAGVFSHLYDFFRRYYHAGDFISLRRYKRGVYAVPYEGEEVKLHWANADQYYIKTAEALKNFAFRLPSGRRVRFELTAASTERDNRKAADDKRRRFVLAGDPVAEEGGELVVRFEYRPAGKKAKQADLNAAAVAAVLGHPAAAGWRDELAAPAPTDKAPGRTLLAKRLAHYTAKNAFDYFIHKDLGGFLRRELDFYIKNEVMHLDDVDRETAPAVESYLSTLKALRAIARKVIDFLAQLEDFQKRLWLKRKFVTETQYVVTLDRVPEALWPEVAANARQVAEWADLFGVTFERAPTAADLKARPHLSIDTRWFGPGFKDAVVQGVEDLAGASRGLMISGENSHALGLLSAGLAGRVDCIYIDPPYNTAASAIAYKNGYKSSSWLAMMAERVGRSVPLLKPAGVLVAAIDDEQQAEFSILLDGLMPAGLIGTFCVRSNPSGRPTQEGYSVSHEYLLVGGKSADSHVTRLPPTEKQLARFNEEDEEGIFEWRNLRREGSNSSRDARRALHYPIYIARSEEIRVPPMDWDPATESWEATEAPRGDEAVVWPIADGGEERTWRWEAETVRSSLDRLAVRKDRTGKDYIYYKRRPNSAGVVAVSSWFDAKYSATEHGTALLKKMFGRNAFSYPKSLHAVKDAVYISGGRRKDAVVLDYFAGSGTTADAVLQLNRDDGGRRRFVLAEVESYFDSVTLPRVKKAIYSAAWEDGKPVGEPTAATSGVYKYLRLESYEDALDNLAPARTAEQQRASWTTDPAFREDYTLHYLLDVETRGSQSLLNVAGFRKPDAYTLRVDRDGEPRTVTVDLPETFNWLLGLTVTRVEVADGVRAVEGTDPAGGRVLVLWRDVDETDDAALGRWFADRGYHDRAEAQGYAAIYVNGDCRLQNLRRPGQTWAVRLTEEHFHRLMFDAAGA